MQEVYLVICRYATYSQVKSVCATKEKAKETFDFLDHMKTDSVIKKPVGTLSTKYSMMDDNCNEVFQEHMYVEKRPLME